MPVVTFDVVAKQYSDAQLQSLLTESSRFFASALGCPVERIRAFVRQHSAELCAVGGALVSETDSRAPMFSIIVLEGRSAEQRRQLLEGMTRIVVNTLQVSVAQVRGAVLPVHPDNWAIAGEVASAIRSAEINARLEKHSTDASCDQSARRAGSSRSGR